jgi:hypothetical protein
LSKKLNPTSGTATFRLGNGILNELHQEAEQRRTSLNTLVSQVLQSHTEYHTFAARAGMVSMPKSLLISLMDSISNNTQQQQQQQKEQQQQQVKEEKRRKEVEEEEKESLISKLSKHNIATNEFKDTVLLMKGRYTIESIIDFIESWARANGFPYRHNVNNNNYYLTKPPKGEDNDDDYYSKRVNVDKRKDYNSNSNSNYTYSYFKGNSNDESDNLSTSSNYNKTNTAATHSFVIQHDMGESWSLYFVELFRFAFEQLGTKVNSNYTPHTFSLEI